MRKVLAVLAATGGLAVGMAAMATSAQADWYGYDWDGWHGGYYQPVDYGYGYGYLNNYAAPVGFSTVSMVAPVPMQTVQTVTVRTVRPSRFSARRVVTRTTVSQIAAETSRSRAMAVARAPL